MLCLANFCVDLTQHVDEIASVVAGEALVCPEEAQELVVVTILNRLFLPGYPKEISQVLRSYYGRQPPEGKTKELVRNVVAKYPQMNVPQNLVFALSREDVEKLQMDRTQAYKKFACHGGLEIFFFTRDAWPKQRKP